MRRETGDGRLVFHFENGEGEADGDDVGTDLAVLLVGDAGALGMDASAGLELELDGHGPAVVRVDLAGDLQRVVVVGDVTDVSRIAERERLVEDVRSSPFNQFFASDAALYHCLS